MCLRSLWSSRREEEDEQLIWQVLEVEVEFKEEEEEEQVIWSSRRKRRKNRSF